jgi:hypothetical protein
MKQYMTKEICTILLSRILPISSLKWFSVACMLVFSFFCDSDIVFSATTSVSKQSHSGESPPDYSASRLVGAMKIGGSSVVVFENAKGEQTFYRTGETFADGSKIVTVNADSIIVRLSDGSKVEYFVMQDGAGKAGIASPGRPATASPPAYIPPPSPSVTSDPESGRVPPRRKRYKTRNSEQEE